MNQTYHLIKNLIYKFEIKKKLNIQDKKLIIAIPYFWFTLFFLFPFFIILRISFSETQIASPPYTSILDYKDKVLTIILSLENYIEIFADNYYLQAFWQSLKTAACATTLCLLIGYPMAYRMVIASNKTQKLLIILIMLPSWISFLIRIYAWMGILKKTGIINSILLKFSLISDPLNILGTQFAVYLGLVYTYLPFMILPIFVNLSRHDQIIYEAASDLGSKPFSTFWRITLPLSQTGVISGCLLVFIPCVGEYVIPELLGGGSNPMIGSVIWQEFFNNRNWPITSAISIIMLIILLLPIIIFNKKTRI
jgi:putrescine transport system permease protein